ncbi:hypothetical protein PVK06_030047 [Gossypium arboreum]|uniref:Reverse transcriptase RNase H-like domain-containing protein n=1 Tax=Gossypium arboreum TaxID=29729 RepID=A0ABR0NM80_GOSAR|nr:hypothetical protein PVK06_030047 [Gossypium arboreum]
MIPSQGEQSRKILQTNASDGYWSTILLEKISGRRRICRYKNECLKDSEIHYHSTFKEILDIKYGIQKFEFYLIECHFTIESDMAVFSQMLNFKTKRLPNAQLLRWAQWFSQYRFTFEHIKSSTNIVPSLLSRPPQPKLIPVIAVMDPYHSQGSSFSTKSTIAYIQTLNKMEANFPLHQLSPKLPTLIKYQRKLIKTMGDTSIQPLGIHPSHPVIRLFCFPEHHWINFTQNTL